MFSSILGFLPLFRRGSRVNRYSHDVTREPALTERKDETNLSTSWSTISHCEIESAYRSGKYDSISGKNKFQNSHRLISGAVSHLNSKPRKEYLASEDISNGREYYKIPAVSYKRNDKPPLDFQYVTDHVQFYSVPLDSSLQTTSSCICENECSDGDCYCASWQKTGRYYDSKGRLARDYDIDSPNVIYECNAGCRCNRKLCKNIVIQNGSKCKVTLFRTKSRGWGVRTLEILKRGTFVGVYSGELVSASSSTYRHDDTYLFNLAGSHISHQETQQQQQQQLPVSVDNSQPDEVTVEEDCSLISENALVNEETKQQVENVCTSLNHNSEQYVCDAKFYGNFTRFINHSCEPNVVGIRSFTSHHDNRFPHIAFFTNQEVPAFTELTLNYGDNYWLVKGKRDGIFCLCKKPRCRFNKKIFNTTLKLHKQQLEAQK